MAWHKKRSYGKMAGKKYSGPPKKKSLTSTVQALAKIVKKDHQQITRSIDYADFRTAPLYVNPVYQVAVCAPLIDPVNWISTCRRSQASTTSVEAIIKKMCLEVGIRHNVLDTSGVTMVWNVIIFHGKGDWYPTTSLNLRPDIDYAQMGVGLPLGFNEDNITILKRWTCRTRAKTTGAPLGDSVCYRTFHLKMNKKIKRTPIQVPATESSWLKMTQVDFTPPEQIYCGIYCDTPEGTNWNQPSVCSFTANFTVTML